MGSLLYTSESGIFSTNRNSPVSTSMLTRMLVPKPKNAFQSPGVHKTGLKSVLPAVPMLVLIVTLPLLISSKSPMPSPLERRRNR
jgi:hypothetical protein